MPAVDWITVKGFKSIASVERLELRPVNMLIGPNGSGKSNLVEAFAFLKSVRDGDLRNYVARAGGAERVLHFGSKQTNRLFIHVSFQNEVNQYIIEIKPDDSDGMFPSLEMVAFWHKAKYNSPLFEPVISRKGEAGISESGEQSGIHDYVRRHLDRWVLYHFHDTGSGSPMRRTADLNDNRRLRADGSNLPSFLYFLRKKHKSEYRLIRRTVRNVAPFFRDFLLEPQALNKDKIRLEWKHHGSDHYFDASSLSDGTLRIIALTTLLLQPNLLRPSVVLLDEPELGLHPYAITVLASLIKQESVNTQIICATQSSLLLDHFSPQDVLVADRVRGGSKFSRFDPESLSEWLQDYSLGQIWEKNLIGGRPGPEQID